MHARRSVELLQAPEESPGYRGFRMQLRAKEGSGLYQVWLRRLDPWDRPLDPRRKSEVWDLRCSMKTDSAFALVQEFELRDLEALPEDWEMPERPDALGELDLNGDALHDQVVRWAWTVTGWGEGPVAERAAKAAAAEAEAKAAAVAAEQEAIAAKEAAAEEARAAIAAVVSPPVETEPSAAAGVESSADDATATGDDDGWSGAEEAVARLTGDFATIPEPATDSET